MIAVNERPRYRGHLHTWTALAAIPAGIFLVIAAQRAVGKVSAVVYGVSVLALFGTSAAYHRLARSVQARLVMQRLDHSMIFVLIAGTYTPLCLVALPATWGIPILCVVWVGAVAGVVLKVAAFDRFRVANYALYPVLGWVAVVALPVLYDRLTTTQLALMLAGGVAYTLGIPVLVRTRPNPWPGTFGYHEVWHTITVVAGVCHFTLVGMLVTS